MSSSSCEPLRKRFKAESPPRGHDDLTKYHDDDLTQGLEETKHHDDLTKNHDDDLTQGLQETKHSTTTTHPTRSVTVRAGSLVTFLDPQDTTKVIKTVTVKRDLRLEFAIIKKDHGKPNDTTTKDTTTTTTETTADRNDNSSFTSEDAVRDLTHDQPRRTPRTRPRARRTGVARFESWRGASGSAQAHDA